MKLKIKAFKSLFLASITVFGINVFIWMRLQDLSQETDTVNVETKLTLNNGCKIPVIGFGAGGLTRSNAYAIIYFAIKKAGFRHIDSSFMHQNEEEVGKAIERAINEKIVKREELFITSKLWTTFHSRKKVIESCQESVQKLGLSYLDLYLVQTPFGVREDTNDLWENQDSGVDYLETWKGMEDCLAAGYTKSIGLSNFNTTQIKRILNACKIKPTMNQIESHPYLSQTNEIEFCRSNGIMVTAFSPLAAGDIPNNEIAISLFEDPILKEIANKHNKSIAQVALRFQIQRGVVAIPFSASTSHIHQNTRIFDFSLNEQEMNSILSLNKDARVIRWDQFKNHRDYPF